MATNGRACLSTPARFICFAAVRRLLPGRRSNCTGKGAVASSLVAYHANAAQKRSTLASARPNTARSRRSVLWGFIGGARGRGGAQIFRNTRLPLVPPKPNEFESATSIFILRAVFGT